MLDELFKRLEKTKFPKNTSRKNISSEPIEAFVLGQVNYRGQASVNFKTKGVSKYNKVFKKLYTLARKTIKDAHPDFKYTTIQLNKNILSPPHVDKNNVGESIIVAVGEFTGGELVIEGKDFDIKNTWKTFDGRLGHWVKPFEGTRYSLVFFTHTFKPPCASLRNIVVREDGLYKNDQLVKSYTRVQAEVQLYNDDCFNIFPKIKEKVDLVLVDLPYNCLNLKWDTEIDLEKMWVKLDTICKRECVYLFFTNTKFGCKLIQSNEKMFKYEIVWQKSRKVGFLQAKNQPLKQTEYVYVFKKTKGCYNPQMSIGKPYKTSGNKANDDYLYENRLKEFKATDNKGIRYPTNIVKFNNPSKSVHPTQKPVDLCEYLVKTYSNEGELVLDFTMGSGSTGVACKNTGRKFIGVEREEKYFEVAKGRLRF